MSGKKETREIGGVGFRESNKKGREREDEGEETEEKERKRAIEGCAVCGESVCM